MGKRALITGVTGQDGSYLAELLLSKGYEVHGIKRRSSSFNTSRVDALLRDFHDPKTRFFLHFADMADSTSLIKVLYRLQPDEIYNLGGQTHVRVSFDIPEYTCDISGLGTVRLLEAVRETGIKAKFYQAGSSEMFGSAPPPQSETTPFHPRSPYAVAKVFSHHITVNYRESYGLFACNGIMFNHESPRRGETFVTRKITWGLARILAGLQDVLYLGNLEAKRDWGYAPDYVEVMWRMLQQPGPGDYVIGTGESHTVREFAELAFGTVGLDWKKYVRQDPRYFRPAEVDHLEANASRAKKLLNWEPRIQFRELVEIMVKADIEELARPRSGALAAEMRPESEG